MIKTKGYANEPRRGRGLPPDSGQQWNSMKKFHLEGERRSKGGDKAAAVTGKRRRRKGK